MAQLNLRLAENAPGELFVDSTCIDCDTCRELAPRTFGSARNGQSFVREQPANDAEWRDALKAVVSCPTASIGAERSARAAAHDLPVPLLPGSPVYRCGYSSEDSYGAQSYYVPGHRLLVDSPRAASPLLKRLAELGGVQRMFLTHRDDVADHEEFHARFGCQRILHRDDVSEGTRSVELQPQGREPRELWPGALLIPVPGHTRGSCALLIDGTYLFTGDHLWGTDDGKPAMGRGVCWYSWDEQRKSLEALLDHSFEWILPGHGRSLHLPKAQLRASLAALAKVG